MNAVRGWILPASLALLLGFGVPESAHACSCAMSGPPCQATWSADVVFVGTVRGIEEIVHDELGAPHTQLLVTFDIERSFVNAALGPVEVVTGRYSSSCGYDFKLRQRYLVYALKRPAGPLYAGRCSRTRPIKEAAEDLRYLTALPAASPGARVYGRITEWRRDPFEDRPVDYGPVEGLVVNVRGAAFTRDAITDRNGRYEVTGVSPGRVTITLMAPPEYDSRHLQRDVELKDPRACSVHDFEVRQIAAAAGTVLDWTGRPAAGVLVDAVASELAGHQPPPYQQPVQTDEHGRFQFDELPPGSYAFGVHLTTERGQRPSGVPTFLPGTRAVGEAAIIELKAGDRRDVGVLRLSPPGIP